MSCDTSATERGSAIFTKKDPSPTVVPVYIDSLTEVETRLNSSTALASSVLSPLLDAADDLDEAARSQELTAQLAEEQIETLSQQVSFALEQAQSNRNAAAGIRRVLGKEESA